MLLARFEKTVEMQLQVFVSVELSLHVSLLSAAERDPFRAAGRPSGHALLDGDADHVHSYAHQAGNDQPRERQRNLEPRRRHKHQVANAGIGGNRLSHD